MLAEFNRLESEENHTGHAQTKSFTKDNGEYWTTFVNKMAIDWYHLNIFWSMGYPNQQFLHVVFYEDLVNNTQHELEKLLNFLEIGIIPEKMKCAMERKEGLFHRKKKNVIEFDPFNSAMRQAIDDAKNSLYKVLLGENDIYQLSEESKFCQFFWNATITDFFKSRLKEICSFSYKSIL